MTTGTTTDPTTHERLLPRRLALAIALAFVALISSGPLLLWFGPRVKTLAAKPFPEWSTDAFLDGRWTEDLRLHLRETSPIIIGFRGVASEALALCGLLEAPLTIGRAGALFAPATLRPATRRLAAERSERTALYRELVAWTGARGIQLLCVPVPDKIRVMPERLPDGGPLREPKKSAYRALLDELRGAGVVAIDLETAMAQWRAERPETPLYYDRDTHWGAFGAWRSSVAIAEELDARGWLDGVEPVALVGMPAQSVVIPELLAGLTGFLEGGVLGHRLLGERTYGGVRLAGPGGVSIPMPRVQPDAGVAVCGDSFAEGELVWSLPAALGRLVDSEGAMAAEGPLHGLLDTLGRIARGELKPRVVVWAFIERSQGESWWAPRPKLP